MSLIKVIHKLFIIVAIGTFITQISCRKDLDFENGDQASFRFSQDTVFLDTLFTQSNSETFLLKVYNDSDNDLLVPNIHLNKQENSNFRINVDGRIGYEFDEVALRSKDSLMVFIEIALGESEDFLAEDEILFGSHQQVKLLAAVEDAIYHYPANGEDIATIEEDTQWNKDKAHVIYGQLLLGKDKTLTISEGTKVYFHQDGELIIKENANLIANGSINSKIIFRSDRHTTRYDTLPNQWKSIHLLPNSKLTARNILLKGATTGLNIDHAHADLHNIEIYNVGSSGIFANNATIDGNNIVISDAGDACLNIENGGTYNFIFSSFANFAMTGVNGVNGPNIPLYLSDYTQEDDNEINSPLHAYFANCIFYGRYPNGAFLDFKNPSTATYSFESCLIKNEDTNEIGYISNPNFIEIGTSDPMFISTIYSNQNLRLKEESPAQEQGNPLYNNLAPTDIVGISRGNNPNIGAYE